MYVKNSKKKLSWWWKGFVHPTKIFFHFKELRGKEILAVFLFVQTFGKISVTGLLFDMWTGNFQNIRKELKKKEFDGKKKFCSSHQAIFFILGSWRGKIKLFCVILITTSSFFNILMYGKKVLFTPPRSFFVLKSWGGNEILAVFLVRAGL